MKLEAGLCVRRGQHKAECQDTALVGGTVFGETLTGISCTAPAWAALLDGVGGNSGGQEASRFAASELASSEPAAEVESVRSWIAAINRRLLAEAASQEGRTQMATTLSGIFFTDDGAVLANAGNTRVYALQGPYLRQLTRDHTTLQMLRDLGGDEGTCNPSEILCCLGGGSPRYLDRLAVSRVFERSVPHTVLMTTDGIHDILTTDEMEQILAEPGSLQEKAEKLCRMAAERGSEDDCSALLVHPCPEGDGICS